MDSFTPVSAAIGGTMIGLAAVLLLAVNGRIAGVSGVAAGLLGPTKDSLAWRIAFIAGLVTAPLAAWAVAGKPPPFNAVYPAWLTLLGGILVGFGARLGGGCTSGHGVCGVARLSRRSLVATAIFIGVAFLVTFALHLAGASAQ